MSEKITVETIRRIGDLARIDISAADAPLVAADLDRIVEYVGQLNELETEAVEPLHHVLDLHDVLRDDKIEPSLAVETVRALFPAAEGDYLKVPKVIKDRG